MIVGVHLRIRICYVHCSMLNVQCSLLEMKFHGNNVFKREERHVNACDVCAYDDTE